MRDVNELIEELCDKCQHSGYGLWHDFQSIIAPAIEQDREEMRKEMRALAVRDCPVHVEDIDAIRDLAHNSISPFASMEHRGALLVALDWAFARIAFLAGETGFADEIAAAEKRGYERAIEEKMAEHPVLHKLWSRAKEHPDYIKEEWMALQRQVEMAKGV